MATDTWICLVELAAYSYIQVLIIILSSWVYLAVLTWYHLLISALDFCSVLQLRYA